MGCDIHCYIEYKGRNHQRWNNFGGRINPGRNYDLFERMAGVRASAVSAGHIAPRGYPEDAAYATGGDYWLWVTEDREAEDGCCCPESAKQWVAAGWSKYKDPDTKSWVSNPDWHSNSWLTADEYEEAIRSWPSEQEYLAILAAMRSLEASGYETRLVFWFDN